MVDKDKIMQSLKLYFTTTGTITIDDRGLVSCTGNVTLTKGKKWNRLPVAFDRVDGSFLCYLNQLKTLQGAPETVGGDFGCYFNQLTTLEHSPQRVGGHFACDGNRLTTLEHAPKSVGTNFSCSKNKLTTLEGLPVVPGELILSYSPTLPLLRCLLAKKVEFSPRLEDKTVETILNRYAGQGRRAMFDCQKELEDAGVEENARW